MRARPENSDIPGQKFFERVAHGFDVIAAAEPQRVKMIDGAQPADIVCAKIWDVVQPMLPRVGRW